MPKQAIERFMDKVMPEPNTGCWIWVGTAIPQGYGRFWYEGRQWPAHRWIYVHVNGPIAENLVTDHLCRMPACVNPAHLEPVTQSENILRGDAPQRTRERNLTRTHCKRGHPFDEKNTRWGFTFRSPSRKKYLRRTCRACVAIRAKVKYRRTRALLDGGQSQ